MSGRPQRNSRNSSTDLFARQENETVLAAAGFTDLPGARRALARLQAGPRGSIWSRRGAALLAALTAAPDPDLALAGLDRLDPLIDGTDLPPPLELPALLRILSVGPLPTEWLERHPEWLGELAALLDTSPTPAPLPPRPLKGDDREALAELLETLNRFKRRSLLHVVARAALGLSSLEQEGAALSLLAESIVGCLLESLWSDDLPRPIVLALGKLGGAELNFSSDLDLMFALEVPENTPATAVLPAATRRLEHLVEALTRHTSRGNLYRIDLRLRPGGDRAPLLRSTAATVTYYARQGAPWERQMLIKARPCAGDQQAGQRLLERLVPFLYPAHAWCDPREEAHRLRRERRAREGTENAHHVKLASGGIRDIEFIVQVLQLLFGGRLPTLRTPSTLEGIDRLQEAALLPTGDAERLEAAYRFLRRTEHLLQMEEDRQTFQLPSSEGRRRALARLMGYPDFDTFQRTYNDHRRAVRRVLNELLPATGEATDGEPTESLLALPLGGEEACRRLVSRGFHQPVRTHGVIVAAGGQARAAGSGAWAAFVGLLPPLLHDAADTGAPDRALNNLERVLRRLGSPGGYFRLLAREAPLRSTLLRLCASGELLPDLLVSHPEHFERLFSRPAATEAADRTGWRRRLRRERRRAQNSAALARRLETLRTREMLAVGLSYVTGEHDMETTLGRLALLARDLLTLFLGCHFADEDRSPLTAVLSLGTLSAGAMTFASDADLLFLHAPGTPSDVQDRTARVAGLLSPPGGPYPVDLRLRPEGRSAPPTVEGGYLARYLAERASPWEALALFRARPLWGRRTLLRTALEPLEEWLTDFELDGAARSALRAVRHRQETAVATEMRDLPGGGGFDVKRSPGAMADIEFIALALSVDGWRPGLPRPAHIPVLLNDLAAAGRIDAAQGKLLTDQYRALRRIQVGLQLHFGRDATRLPSRWGQDPPAPWLLGEDPVRVLGQARAVRALFDHFLAD